VADNGDIRLSIDQIKYSPLSHKRYFFNGFTRHNILI